MRLIRIVSSLAARVSIGESFADCCWYGYWRAIFSLASNWCLPFNFKFVGAHRKAFAFHCNDTINSKQFFCASILFVCRLIVALRLISNLSAVHECAVEIKILDTDTEKTDSISFHRNAYLCVYACHWRLDCPPIVSCDKCTHFLCSTLPVGLHWHIVWVRRRSWNYVIWDNERHCPRTFHSLEFTDFLPLHSLICRYSVNIHRLL